ncbi:MAG: hypothetical protein OXC48_05055 [Endozoicomonadaceae bacterium]|nr:hypothetical protein [Endozoicomonadaceae bacterium]
MPEFASISINDSGAAFDHSSPASESAITFRAEIDYMERIEKKYKNTPSWFLTPREKFLKAVKIHLKSLKTKIWNLIVVINVKLAGTLCSVFNSIQRLNSFVFKSERRLLIPFKIYDNLYKISVDQQWNDIVKYMDKNYNTIVIGVCQGLSNLLNIALLNEANNENLNELTYKDFVFFSDLLTGNKKYKSDTLSEENKVKMKMFIEKLFIHQHMRGVGSGDKLKLAGLKFFGNRTKQEFIDAFVEFIERVKESPAPVGLIVHGSISYPRFRHASGVGFLKDKAFFYNFPYAYYNAATEEKTYHAKEFDLNSRADMEQLAADIFDGYQILPPWQRVNDFDMLIKTYSSQLDFDDGKFLLKSE